MSEILVKNKDIVVPGEELAEGMDYLPGDGTYRQGEVIRANKMGLAFVDGRAIKIVPVSGAYLPKKGDVIIGKVVDLTYSGWIIDFGSAYRAMLGLKDATSDFIAKGADLTRYYDINDMVVAKIYNVTSQNLTDLTLKGPGLRKLNGGRVINVTPNKVPRIIGKSGSMISLVKDATKCNIVVGQNGVVWISGEPEMEIIAVETIRKIECESHRSGLTDEIAKYLKDKVGDFGSKDAGKVDAKEAPKKEEPKPSKENKGE